MVQGLGKGIREQDHGTVLTKGVNKERQSMVEEPEQQERPESTSLTPLECKKLCNKVILQMITNKAFPDTEYNRNNNNYGYLRNMRSDQRASNP